MCPKTKNVLHFFNLLKNPNFLQNSAKVLILCLANCKKFAQILISCFAKFIKISRNTKLKLSRKFREITKTKFFAATLEWVIGWGRIENKAWVSSPFHKSEWGAWGLRH